ncbi:hypothetical protein [Limnohabitans sp. WS1]|uniref:hypothetical protein n=1 Tax=Limnohabitans sp. WS1 TaxID=1100726 RepID=UPI0011B1C93D|nr:hypothetical protein [Limnohabitans sp. WS1]
MSTEKKGILDRILDGFGGILKFIGVMIGFIIIGSIFTTCSMMGKVSEKVSQQEEKIKSVATTNSETKSPAPEAQTNNTSVLTGKLIKKEVKFDEYGFGRGTINLKISVKNNTDEQISGYKVIFHFYNLFGDKITSNSYEGDENIQPGKEIILNLTKSFNSNMPTRYSEEISLAQYEQSKIKFAIETESIVNKDGKITNY